jgi:hypothetical protein
MNRNDVEMSIVTRVLLLTLGLQAGLHASLVMAPVTLRGSPEAMIEQNRIAVEHGLEFFTTRGEIDTAVARGDLVHLPGDANYEVADFVDPPYAHPTALHFIERVAALNHEACGEPLVVTSAVRPIDEQPPNAHALSVHPAGVAVDFRVSQTAACREWFEEKLLTLEALDVINATREQRPPHYHVAIYPEPYGAYTRDNPLARPEPEVAAAPEDPSHPAGPDRRSWGFGVVGIGALLFLIWHLRKGGGFPGPPRGD